MFTAYIVVTGLAVGANTFAATADVIRPRWLLANMAKTGVAQSWLLPLGALKAAGALGLLLGIGVPPLGIAAAAGLVLFFLGAIVVHIRARAWGIAPPAVFLALAAASLVLRLVAPTS